MSQNKIKELIKELEEMHSDAKGYLKEYIKDNEEGITSIDEFDNCVSSEVDMYTVRVYDLAQMQITKRLLIKLQENYE
tara:strand:+ start:349 stop:582 length:234 start_codon:yes stop_codon:yes gene_type:complete